MTLNKLDVRGRSCPEPVLLTKKALAGSPQGIQVVVDNTTAKDNVKRFAEKNGYKTKVEEYGADFILTITR